jgi:hypothetical protein
MSQVRLTHDLFLVFRHAHSIAYLLHTALEECKKMQISVIYLGTSIQKWIVFTQFKAFGRVSCLISNINLSWMQNMKICQG